MLEHVFPVEGNILVLLAQSFCFLNCLHEGMEVGLRSKFFFLFVFKSLSDPERMKLEPRDEEFCHIVYRVDF
jgi:hypothetical protein